MRRGRWRGNWRHAAGLRWRRRRNRAAVWRFGRCWRSSGGVDGEVLDRGARCDAGGGRRGRRLPTVTSDRWRDRWRRRRTNATAMVATTAAVGDATPVERGGCGATARQSGGCRGCGVDRQRHMAGSGVDNCRWQRRTRRRRRDGCWLRGGGGLRRSGGLRRRWLVSVAAATTAVIVEAMAMSAGGMESRAR